MVYGIPCWAGTSPSSARSGWASPSSPGWSAGSGWTRRRGASPPARASWRVVALLVGFARSIALLLEHGQVLHTIVHGLSLPLQQVMPELSAVGMLLMQTASTSSSRPAAGRRSPPCRSWRRWPTSSGVPPGRRARVPVRRRLLQHDPAHEHRADGDPRRGRHPVRPLVPLRCRARAAPSCIAAAAAWSRCPGDCSRTHRVPCVARIIPMRVVTRPLRLRVQALRRRHEREPALPTAEVAPPPGFRESGGVCTTEYAHG
jgi:hypothetical protein